MVDTNKLTLEWLAGFFDGEGSVSLRSHVGEWQLRINLTQAHYPLLAAIAAKFGANYGPYTKTRRTKTGKESIVYEIGWTRRSSCREILIALQPHVVVKAQQVALALEFLDTCVGSGNRYDETVRAKREAIRNRMRWLNHAGPFKPASETVFTSPEHAGESYVQ